MASMYGQNAVTYLGTTRLPTKLGTLPPQNQQQQQQQHQQQRRGRDPPRLNLGRMSTHSQTHSAMTSKHGRVLNAIPQSQNASHHRGVRTRMSDDSPVSVIGATALPISIPYNIQGSKGAVMELSQLTSFSSDWGGSAGSLPSEWQHCVKGQALDPPLGQEILSQVSQASNTSSIISPFQQFQMEQREGAKQHQQQQQQREGAKQHQQQQQPQHPKNRRFVHNARETPVVHTQMLPPAPVSFKDYVHLNPRHTIQRVGSSLFRPDPSYKLNVRGAVDKGHCVATLRQNELRSQNLTQNSKLTQSSHIGSNHSALQTLDSNSQTLSHPHSLELSRTTRTALKHTSECPGVNSRVDAVLERIEAVESQVNSLLAKGLENMNKVLLEQKVAAEAFVEQVADATKQIDVKTNDFMIQAADIEKKHEVTAERIDQQATTITTIYDTVKSFMKYWTTSTVGPTLSATSSISSLATPTKEPHVSPDRISTPTSTQTKSLKKPTTSKEHHRSISKLKRSRRLAETAGGVATGAKGTTLLVGTSTTSTSPQDLTGAPRSALSSKTNTTKNDVTSDSAAGYRSCKTFAGSMPSLSKKLKRCVDKKFKQSMDSRYPSKTVPLPRALHSCVTPCNKGTHPFKIHGEIGNASTATTSKKRSFGGIAHNKHASKRIRVKLSIPSQIIFADDESDGFL